MERRLSTGFGALDVVLGGGFRFGKVSLIYGEASTGKTTLALGCVAQYLDGNPQGKVFYIDGDGKLSTNRIMQITGGKADRLERLLVLRPSSFSELTGIIEGLSGLLPRRPTPVVLDPITGLYRLEAGNPDKTFSANKELNRQLGFLAEMAETVGAAILLTGQVHSALGSEPVTVEMVAQRLLTYWSDVILRLELTHLSGVRRAILEKPPDADKVCMFTIGSTGLKQVEKPW